MIRSFAALLVAVLCSSGIAVPAHAAELQVSGWIPYWAVKDGIKDAKAHLDVLSELHPFSYVVQKDGSLKDLAGMSSSSWKKLISSAKSKGVRMVPTVMWSDTASITHILSDSTLRTAHIREITDLVKKKGYDGINIDYEGKNVGVRAGFSAFLKELKAALGSKVLTCTIEARTPPDSLYTTVPKDLEYVNDYVEINKYCDRVEIMAYDQQRADLKLNSARSGEPYYPVADIDWVRKVMTLTAQSIDKSKLFISVPTYGREVQVTVAPNWYKSYAQVSSVSDEYARDTADDYDITPNRNKAGELSYSYLPKDSALKLASLPKAPKGTSSGNEVAARALAYANATGKTVTVNVVWWSDAEAIAQKVAFAKELGLAGIAVFKFDGKEDEDLWDLF